MLLSIEGVQDMHLQVPSRRWLFWWHHTVFYTLFLLCFVGPLGGLITFAPFPSLYHSLLFYWSARRQAHISLIFLFILGLFFDILFVRFFGATFLECVLFLLIAKSQAPLLAKSSFSMQWFLFAMTLCLYTVVMFFAFYLMGWAGSLMPVFWSWFFLVVSYPLVVFVVKSACIESFSR